ncbi:MAG: zinc-dependent peptidase [Deltaproteobacteria bacterium]|nr:zinc-dependent peptidase [Deltaproteobacteria bacterium]MBW2540822.1 zinc-dependent peptidase [Deltaproteobacteria bacterium]
MLRRCIRRRRALAQPFPDDWLAIIQQNVPPYSNLSPEMQRQVQGYTQEFLYDKNFEGCGGLVLDDEIRVTIAAQASLLLLNRKVRCYPKLYSVLVYPSAYVAKSETDGESVRLGESWRTGAVVLAWDSARHGAANFADGRNLVIHEFAHQLDQEDGSSDGAPILDGSSCYTTWARVLSRDYERLREQVDKGKKSVIDAYGASHPAEFFAVASEAFFEKPRQLGSKHPELYDELQKFYRVDPREWF